MAGPNQKNRSTSTTRSESEDQQLFHEYGTSVYDICDSGVLEIALHTT